MLQKLSKREKIMLAVLVVLIMIVGFYKYLLTPQLEAYKEMTQRLDQAELELQNAKTFSKSGDKLNEQIRQNEERLSQLQSQFEAEVRDGAGLVKLAMQSLNDKVTLIGFKPLPVQDQKYYYEVPFRIKLRGDYVNVLGYFKNLEQQKAIPNVIEIRDLKIELAKPKENEQNREGTVLPITGSGKKANGKVEADFVLMVYTKHDPKSLLALNEISKWAVGRHNTFLQPEPVSPYPGVESTLPGFVFEPGTGNPIGYSLPPGYYFPAGSPDRPVITAPEPKN